MPVREGDTRVVAEAAHDEVVADEQGVFHGARGNHAGLAKCSVNQQEYEDDPHPGNDFSLDALPTGEYFRWLFVFWLHGFHSSPTCSLYLVDSAFTFYRDIPTVHSFRRKLRRVGLYGVSCRFAPRDV